MPTNATAAATADELTVRRRHLRQRVDAAALRRLILRALGDPVFCRATPSSPGAGPVRYQLGFHLVGAEEMARLNREQLGHEGPTDVITLDYGPPPLARPDECWLCGEVFICVEVARRQSRAFRTSWQSELARYAVHGLLHLAGFDDRSPGQRRVMKREEDRLVAALTPTARRRRSVPRPTAPGRSAVRARAS